MASAIAAIDLGTTAVKVALVSAQDFSVLVSRSVDTAADEEAGEGAREQRVDLILSALGSALLMLFGRGTPPRPPVVGVAITGQMHGVVTWRREDPAGTASPLVTWRDGRGAGPNGGVARLNGRVWAATGGRGRPLFPGYGCATLAASLAAGGEEWDAAGTIGAYVAAALVGDRTAVLTPSDAAAWGCYDVEGGRWDEAGAAAAHPLLPLRLPHVVAAGGGCAGRVGAGSWSHPSLAPCIPASWAGVPVAAAVGDHAAAVLAGLRGAPARAAFINIGTSAQIAVCGWAGGAPLSPGCEVRPSLHPSSPHMLVGAAMNGGSALQEVVEAVRAAAGEGGPGTDATYAWLEREARRSAPAGGAPLTIGPLPLPERWAEGWGDGGAPLQPPHPSGALSLRSALAALAPGHPSRLRPGAVYASTAAAVVSSLLATLPPGALHGVPVVMAGGALARSTVLQTALGAALGEQALEGGEAGEYAGCVGAALAAAHLFGQV
jgi:sugar (pentulose or hexulose) kinase